MDTTVTSKPKRVFLIDASLLKESDCLRKVNFIHNEGLTTTLAKYKADYGTGFHKFVAPYTAGLDPAKCMQIGANFFLEKCLAVPENDFRTIDHMMMTMQTYIKGPFRREIDLLKPKIINNKPAVELQFSFPYITTPDYDIMLTGTCDMLGSYLGRDVINDYKVTATWESNAEKYLSSYELDPQLIFYSWILKTYGITETYLPGLITGIFIKKPTKTKEVNGKRVAVDCWNGASFIRSAIIEFSLQQIQEFEVWLKAKIQSIVDCYIGGNIWPPNFNCCADIFGPCDFCSLCKDFNHETREFKKKNMYMVRKYDPAMFQQ